MLVSVNKKMRIPKKDILISTFNLNLDITLFFKSTQTSSYFNLCFLVNKSYS